MHGVVALYLSAEENLNIPINVRHRRRSRRGKSRLFPKRNKVQIKIDTR